jgi:hypothetical protein
MLIPGRYQTEVSMTFIVTGFSRVGPALVGCDTEILALDKAVELIRAGYVEVLIADGQGVQYTPSQFLRAFHL